MPITFVDSLLELPKRASREEWRAIYERLARLEITVNQAGSFWCKSELDRLERACNIAWTAFN